MIFLQPTDIRRDGARARLNPPVIRVDGSVAGRRLALRIVKKPADVGVQRALVALQRQRIVAAPIDDLPGNLALAVAGIERDDGAPAFARAGF